MAHDCVNKYRKALLPTLALWYQHPTDCDIFEAKVVNGDSVVIVNQTKDLVDFQ